jgi:hypothetical protein
MLVPTPVGGADIGGLTPKLWVPVPTVMLTIFHVTPLQTILSPTFNVPKNVAWFAADASMSLTTSFLKSVD